MPYTGDPVNVTTDAVRMLIRDTSTSAPLLTDNEVSYLVANHANVYYAAAGGADMIAGSKSDAVNVKKVGDLTLTKGAAGTGISGEYRSLASSLRIQAARNGVKGFAGGISIAEEVSARADADYQPPDVGLYVHDYYGPNADSSTSGKANF